MNTQHQQKRQPSLPIGTAGGERLQAGSVGTGEARATGESSTRPISAGTTTLFRVGIIVTAPAVVLVGHAYHPWIGNPGDPGFLERLAAAVAADPTRWAVAHFLVALGSALVVLAFLAVRRFLDEAGERRWSAVGLPFIIVGSVLYAMLPAMEFAPFGAQRAGADIAAVQAGLMSWFTVILMAAAALFAIGILGFALGIARSGVVGGGIKWTVLAALVIMAASRFFPVGAAQLYVGPVAGALGLWLLAYVMWNQSHRRAAGRPGIAPPS